MPDGSRAVLATSAALVARLGPPPVSEMPPPASAFVSGHRKGDKYFFEGSVACMATDARSCFTEDAAEAVVHHARVVVAEFPATPPLSVGDLWAMRGGGCWEEQRRSDYIMRLVVSLRQAHDGAPETVFGPPRPRMRPTWSAWRRVSINGTIPTSAAPAEEVAQVSAAAVVPTSAV
ncbi:unnamed protein product, partial [Laminaria digitata]